MPVPIALQLYTVRNTLAHDFAGTVRKIAEMGYAGVETAGFPGTTPKKARALFDELGLEVSSAHAALPIGEQQNEVLETMAEIGCRRLVCPSLGPESYATLDQIKRTCDLVNKAHKIAAEHGLLLGLHNHWWEFQPVEGHYPYQILLERLDPAVFFQLDVYWVKTAGLDPVNVIKELGARVPLLHIKDGPCVIDKPQVAVGEGLMDFHSIVKASGPAAEWLIVELDECATDMMEAVEKSYRYLVRAGLATGKRN